MNTTAESPVKATKTIAAVSDLHGHLPPIPECDILLIAGDVCPGWDHSAIFQNCWLANEFTDWLEQAPAKHIVLVWGNHDLVAQRKPEMVPRLPCHVLTDQKIVIEGLTIYGSPWQLSFYDWAFNLDAAELAKKWELIPHDTDILVLHSPAYGLGDFAPRHNGAGGEHAGCPALLEKLKQIKPKLTVYGHIHAGRGVYDLDGSIVANVSLVNEQYTPVHSPMIFEV